MTKRRATQDPARYPLPRLDRLVYDLLGQGLLWLGKRAVRRHDLLFATAMCDALYAGHVDANTRLSAPRVAR